MENPKCPICGKDVKWNVARKRWCKFCSTKCSTQNPDVQAKRKATNVAKFGTEYAIGAKEVRRKIEESFQNRYGVSSPGAILETIKKAKATNKERYGGWYMGTQEFRNKSKETNKKTLGVEYPAQSAEVNAKKHATNMEKYGVKETFSSPEVKKKRKKTMEEVYGAEYPMQSPELKREALRKSGHRRTGGFKGYDYKGLSFDSTYELAYYLWLKHLGKSFIYHPDTPLSYVGTDGLEHLYMPDFLVEGKFYEIKGGCFFNKDGEPYNQYSKEYWWEKYNTMIDSGIIILREKDIKEAFEYVRREHGKDFLRSCKVLPKPVK